LADPTGSHDHRSVARTDERFRFAFDDRFRLPLAAVGVTRATAFVSLTAADVLVARFGPWTCETPLANVTCVERTGPYRWWRAIGARLSFADLGATFGSTTAGGVCLCFAEPVRALDAIGLLRHPGLTVTVADLDGFAAAVERRIAD
jgi:hypothetical protein